MTHTNTLVRARAYSLTFFISGLFRNNSEASKPESINTGRGNSPNNQDPPHYRWLLPVTCVVFIFFFHNLGLFDNFLTQQPKIEKEFEELPSSTHQATSEIYDNNDRQNQKTLIQIYRKKIERSEVNAEDLKKIIANLKDFCFNHESLEACILLSEIFSQGKGSMKFPDIIATVFLIIDEDFLKNNHQLWNALAYSKQEYDRKFELTNARHEEKHGIDPQYLNNLGQHIANLLLYEHVRLMIHRRINAHNIREIERLISIFTSFSGETYAQINKKGAELLLELYKEAKTKEVLAILLEIKRIDTILATPLTRELREKTERKRSDLIFQLKEEGGRISDGYAKYITTEPFKQNPELN